MPTSQHPIKRKAKRKPASAFPLLAPVSTFAPEPFEVIKDFSVVVEPRNGSFVATLFDANIGASAETAEDAVQNLKDTLLNAFAILEQHEGELGFEPKRQLAVLRSFIRRRA